MSVIPIQATFDIYFLYNILTLHLQSTSSYTQPTIKHWNVIKCQSGTTYHGLYIYVMSPYNLVYSIKLIMQLVRMIIPQIVFTLCIIVIHKLISWFSKNEQKKTTLIEGSSITTAELSYIFSLFIQLDVHISTFPTINYNNNKANYLYFSPILYFT